MIPDRALVLGLGNPIMGDDGAGVAALEMLRARWELPEAVELVDGGTWGMNLLPLIEAHDHVILFDAIECRARPGALIRLTGAALPRWFEHKLSPHQIDLREVLALAELRGRLPGDLVAIGVQPERIEMETTLTAPVTAALGKMVGLAVDKLRRLGYRPVRLEYAGA